MRDFDWSIIDIYLLFVDTIIFYNGFASTDAAGAASAWTRKSLFPASVADPARPSSNPGVP